jgi:Ca2+-binding RTX toxin-like protein
VAFFSRAAVIAAVTMIVSAPAALATVTVGADGTTVQMLSTDTGGNNSLSVRYEDPYITFNGLDGWAVDASATANCVKENQYKVTCDNAYGDLEAQFAGSNDNVTLELCFNTVAIDLGNGTNEYHGAACSSGTATVAGGTGQDTLYGGSFAGTETVDQLFGNGGADLIYGGDGNDVLHGGEGDDTTDGGPGNDELDAEGGNDVLRGGPGNDTENGGAGDDRVGYSPGVSDDDDQGADSVSGGDGSDKLILDGHTGGMTISLDGQANDGSPGEGDNVAADFESIDGTNAPDVFTGSAGPDQFSGGQGNDDIHGGAGEDQLYGGSGDDTLNGDGGNDKVEGANGSDKVDGGAGADQIYGDIGSCSFSCSSDADYLYARDGERDAVDCGGGSDTAQVDTIDVVTFCASVDALGTPPAPGPGGTPGGGDGGGAAAALGLKAASSLRKSALLKRGLAVQLNCDGPCKIALELRYKSRKLGSARKTLLKAGVAKLRLNVDKKGRAALRRLKSGRLTLRVKVTDATGKVTSATQAIKLKR